VSLRDPSRRLGHTIHELGTVESTQIVAARMAVGGAPEGTVVTAAHQTGGRGRRGRCWVDAAGESLLMSVILRPPGRPEEAPRLSLVAGIAVVDALRSLAGLRARIRWPNDVLVGERKICGILPEAATSGPDTLAHVILGIGLNVNQAFFADAWRTLPTSVRIETGRVSGLGETRRSVLEALADRYERFLATGLPGLREAWLERAYSIGRKVRAGDGRVGVVVDLADDGALVIRTESGETMRILTGEVTMEAADAARH